MVSSLGRAAMAALVGTAALVALAACNGGPASTPARDHAASGAASGYANRTGGGNGGTASTDASAPDPRKLPIPQIEGKPMWAANRRHTAEENAQYHFERDGADFGARNVDDYVHKAHVFVTKPPSGIATLTRSNGDKLIYDAKGNVFAVVTREGAPRTMFKPRDGAAYWEQQKQREEARADGGSGSDRADGETSRRYTRRSSHRSDSDDQG